MAEQVHHEGSPWFWKIFGGAIMGLVSILLISIISNINNTIDRSFDVIRSDNKALSAGLDATKQKITALEAVDSMQKEEMKSLREWNKELSRQVVELRERLTALEAAKKKE